MMQEDLKRQLAEDVTRLRTYASLTGSANGLDWHKDRVIEKKWEIPAVGRTDRKKVLAQIAAAKERVDAKTVQVQQVMDGKMKSMEERINTAMDEVIANAAFTGSDEHIRQVVGFVPDDIEKVGAWNGEEYTSTADNGEVRGRNFYSVHFNWYLGVDDFAVGHAPLGPRSYTQQEYVAIAQQQLRELFAIFDEDDDGRPPYEVWSAAIPENIYVCLTHSLSLALSHRGVVRRRHRLEHGGGLGDGARGCARRARRPSCAASCARRRSTS